MPDVYGQQYEAIPADRVFPYSREQPAAELRRRWPDARRRTSEVAGNAFYCSNGDFVAYDEQGLLPKLREQLRRVRGGPRVRPRARPRGAGARRVRPVGHRLPGAAGRLLRRCVGAARRRQRRRERAPLDERPRQRARRSADPERPVGHRRRAGRRARQRLRPGRARSRTATRAARRRAPTTRTTRPTSPSPATRATQDQATDGNLPARRAGADGHQEPRRVLGLAVVEAHRADRCRPVARATGDGSDGGVLTDSRHLRPVDATPCTTTRRRCRTCTTPSATSAAACSWRPRGRRRWSTSSAATSAPTHARRGAECLAGAWAASHVVVAVAR